MLVDALTEHANEIRLQCRPHLGEPFNSTGRAEQRLVVAGEGDQGTSKAAIKGACREGRDAGGLHCAVEGLVVVAEALVVRTVARLVDVEQGDDQPWPLVVAPDAAGGLDVLGGEHGLADDHHQAQALDVEADRDHIGGERAVNPVINVVKGRLQVAAGFGDLVGGDP